jgi:Raf kinase inhibitor-like YbhB/YbcL family protein
MKTSKIGSVLVVTLVLVATTQIALQGQSRNATTENVNGHVYEPAKMEPTDERINQLKLPDGFHISKFAALSNPRMMAVADDGTIYVTQREPGTLVCLRDTDNDGIADVQKVVAEKKMLHGITIHRGKMYLVTVKEVFVADIKSDGTLGEMRTIINDLPDGGQHPNRTLAVGPDEMLYVTVGSTCNTCNETNPESATVLRATLDGKQRNVYATGLRNTIGFGWHPVSKKMYGMDHGIDWLGDNEQHEELNELVANTRYGWPFVYDDGKTVAHPQPPKDFTKEMWARMSKNPALLYTPHSAPMQMVFYTGNQFPAQYRNDAFVAMRGSWNRNPPSGYEIVRVRFDKSGTPASIEPFITGFLIKGEAPEGKDAIFGRPVGLAIAKDGSLLVGDDTNNIIYRVYAGADRNRRAGERKMYPQVISFNLPETQAAASITVNSKAFKPNSPIPDEHSDYGQKRSPQLSWSGVPEAAKSLVLMVEDPDALSPKPFVHWLVINIPPTVNSLPASLPNSEMLAAILGAMQGATNTSAIGYYGPHPPAGEPPHHYHFQVFALDTMLQLPSGFNRQALLDAIKGHVLAKGELVGTYQRK